MLKDIVVGGIYCEEDTLNPSSQICTPIVSLISNDGTYTWKIINNALPPTPAFSSLSSVRFSEDGEKVMALVSSGSSERTITVIASESGIILNAFDFIAINTH